MFEIATNGKEADEVKTEEGLRNAFKTPKRDLKVERAAEAKKGRDERLRSMGIVLN
jgi:hypothetical protein